MKRIGWMLCCALWTQVAWVDKQPVALSLKDAALLSVAHNARAQNASLQWVLDKFKWQVAQNAFQWQFNLSGEMIHKKGHEDYYAANPSARLTLPTGGSVTVEGTWFSGGGIKPYLDRDGSITLSETSRTGSLTLRQPLLRGFGPSVAQADLHNAQNQQDIDGIGYEEQLSLTVNRAIKAYWEVLQAKQSLRVQVMALDQAEKVLKQYRVRIKVGNMAASNALQQEAQVVSSRLSLVEQENRVQQSYQDLLVSIGLKPSSEVSVNMDVKHLQMLQFMELKPSIAFGMAHHFGLRVARLRLKQLERQLLVAQNEQLWSLDVEGQINSAHDPQVGLRLSVPLRDLKRKQRLLSAKVQLSQAKQEYAQLEKEVETQIINHWRKLHLVLNRIDLLDQKVKLSEKNYHVTIKQHLNGHASSFEVVAQQRQWIGDQIGLISAKIEYLKTLANFHLLLGKTLSVWGITL